MGGFGSGGHNKKHEQVEKKTSVRVDSFAVYNFLQYDKYIHYKEKVDIRSGGTVIRYYPQSREMEILENRAFYPLEVSRVKNIDGVSQRLYFYCPCCERRVRYLYRDSRKGTYQCRLCSGLNYRSQQVSGQEQLRMKMENIVEKKMGYYGWHYICDYIADLSIPPKPAYMRYEKYEKLVSELKKMQRDYRTACIKTFTGFCSKYGF